MMTQGLSAPQLTLGHEQATWLVGYQVWLRQQPWRSVWGQRLTGVTQERRK